LKKGDILLWHPYTIHGSYQNQNPAYSRKSFTAHFHPLGLQRLYVQECLKVRSTVNPRLYITCEKIPDWLWNLKSYPQYLQQLISGEKAFLDMRRNSY
jgi:phytanoyl-CoA hydroxylase